MYLSNGQLIGSFSFCAVYEALWALPNLGWTLPLVSKCSFAAKASKRASNGEKVVPRRETSRKKKFLRFHTQKRLLRAGNWRSWQTLLSNPFAFHEYSWICYWSQFSKWMRGIETRVVAISLVNAESVRDILEMAKNQRTEWEVSAYQRPLNSSRSFYCFLPDELCIIKLTDSIGSLHFASEIVLSFQLAPSGWILKWERIEQWDEEEANLPLAGVSKGRGEGDEYGGGGKWGWRGIWLQFGTIFARGWPQSTTRFWSVDLIVFG